MSIDLNRDALVVGICRYDSLTMSEELKTLAKQAEQLAQLLETKGDFKVKRLPCTAEMCLHLKERVTSFKLKKSIEELFYPPEQAPTQTALLFFAGHGLMESTRVGNEGFLATSEADNKSVYGVSYQWLAKTLCNSPIKQQIVFIEACHSGAFLEAIKEEKKKSCFKDKDICLITSSRAHEESLANGLLTQDLLDILKNQNMTTDLLIKELNKKEKEPNRGWQRFQIESLGNPITLTSISDQKTLVNKSLIQDLSHQDLLDILQDSNITREILIKALINKEKRPHLQIATPSKIFTHSIQPIQTPNLVGLREESFSFEVVTVDENGKEIKRQTQSNKQAIFDLGKGVKLEMVSIPKGSFQMGSNEYDREKPIHEVKIENAFYMGKYPVTQAQYQQIMGNNPSNFKGEKRPVETVSWLEAVEFCKKLSQKLEMEFRLPTEAEWEYACRAKTTTPFHFGETITTELVNYDGNYPYGNTPKGDYRRQTVEVDYFKHANNFGLYQMHGNIWEWTCSNYGKYSENNHLECSNNNNANKVLRGGSWLNYAGFCRSAYRVNYVPDFRFNYHGFRVVSVFSL